MQKTTNLPAILFACITALTTWFALGLQLYLLINLHSHGFTPLQAISRFFSYFTILTNIMVAISLTFILITPNSYAGKFSGSQVTITAIAVYIFIVGLIYNILLRQLWHPGGLQKLADELLHVAVPILYILYWFIFVSKDSLKWRLYFHLAALPGHLPGLYAYSRNG